MEDTELGNETFIRTGSGGTVLLKCLEGCREVKLNSFFILAGAVEITKNYTRQERVEKVFFCERCGAYVRDPLVD